MNKLIFLLFIVVFRASAATSIFVVTNDEYPINKDMDGVVYNLDDTDRILSEVNKKLPDTLSGAKQFLKDNPDIVSKHRVELIKSTKGLRLVAQYKIERIPAIVFDGHYVVYGVTSVRDAFKYFKESQNE